MEKTLVIKEKTDIDKLLENEEYTSALVPRNTLMCLLSEKEQYYEYLTDAISDIIEFRNFESGMHTRRVKNLTKAVANAYRTLYPQSNLNRAKVDMITRASTLHDIGKLVIPDTILLKPGRLTEKERLVMMGHTTKGCEILGLLKGRQSEEQLKIAYEICRYHHERHDGNGYPDGLRGEEIPLSARIVSIVDVYDALVTDRVYKKAYDKETAYKMILDGECGVFSPELLNSFRYCKKLLELISESYSA